MLRMMNPHGPIRPVYTIRIYEPDDRSLWVGDLTNDSDKQVASAPELRTVWEMLATVIETRVPVPIRV